MSPTDLPRGFLSFLFTDIEGSSGLWERHGQGMGAALGRHDALLRTAVEEHLGRVVKTTGDGAYAVFAGAADSMLAAADFQRALAAEAWPSIAPDAIRARAGIHSGTAEPEQGDYHSSTLNIAARLMSAGHGGQVLLSETTARAGPLPAGLAARDLGRYRLRGISEPQAVLQLVGEGLRAEFPELNAQNTAVRNLPGQTTPFVGRLRELAEVRHHLLETERRLMTILAPGGMGKTRLAIEAARRVAAESDRYPDGVVFVGLAPVDTRAAAARTIADALGFRYGSDETPADQQLIAYLGEKQLLLILDNLEHLLADGLAALIDNILTASPGVEVLTTSRERLNLRGETVLALGGLDAPQPSEQAGAGDEQQSDAVMLFLQSARRVAPGFGLTAENMPHIVRICRLTAGMPLAIELAAGWTGVLAPAEIAAELEKGFDLLSTTMGDVPARQRSLRAVFDGSWALLSAAEQEAFLRLSVFRGGFRRVEGEEATGASLPLLLLLVNKSFLQREENGRFGLQEQLRAFANQRLRQDQDAHTAAKQAHSRTYSDFLAAQLPRLRSADQLAALEEIDTDLDNVRVAVQWLVQQQAYEQLIARMMPGLFRYANLRLRFMELEPLLERALEALRAAGGVESNVAGIILQTAVVDIAVQRLNFPPFIYPHGDALFRAMWPYALEHREEMGEWFDLFLQHHMANVDGQQAYFVWLERLDELRQGGAAWPLARALQMLGEVLFLTWRNQDLPLDLLGEALPLFRAEGDIFETAQSLYHLGWMQIWHGEYERAVRYIQEAQELLAAQGEHLRRGRMLREMQVIYLKLGQRRQAFSYLAEEQLLYRRLNRLDLLRESLHWESISAARYSDLEHARRTRRESMALEERLAEANAAGQPSLEWDYFELAEIARVAGDLAESRRYLEMARSLFALQQSEKGLPYYSRALADLELANGRFARAEPLYRQNLEWALDSSRQFEAALALTGLGRALTALGRLAEAEQALQEALTLADNPGIIDLVIWPITGLAGLRAAQGRPLEAAQLAAFVLAHHLSWREMRDVAQALLRVLEPELPPAWEAQAAAQTAVREVIPGLKLSHLPLAAFAGDPLGAPTDD